MKKILLVSAALGGLLFYENHFGQSHTTKHLAASDVSAVDGDTLDHGGDRYRLVGFDTPETYRAQCAAEKELGLKAKHRLTDIIRVAGTVDLEIEPSRDKYGRFLAVARADGRDVGAILISEGLARPYDGGKRQPWC